MGMEDLCNTGLKLGLGNSMPPTNDPQNPPIKVAAVSASSFEPAAYLTLALSASDDSNLLKKKDMVMMMEGVVADQYPYGRQGSPHSSALSSFSVKRERGLSSEEVEAAEKPPLFYSEEDDAIINNNARKKLRLTKEQSALLEESFNHHSTLNPKQKQALARQLNLRPRQVEVWFQNRRARTKLKQTEVDCELLKKWCESLTEENRRLQREVQALKSSTTQPPFYMHVPSPTLTTCPSCSERITITEQKGAAPTPTTNSAAAANNTPLFSPTKHFYNPFINNPSAAC